MITSLIESRQVKDEMKPDSCWTYKNILPGSLVFLWIHITCTSSVRLCSPNGTKASDKGRRQQAEARGPGKSYDVEPKHLSSAFIVSPPFVSFQSSAISVKVTLPWGLAHVWKSSQGSDCDNGHHDQPHLQTSRICKWNQRFNIGNSNTATHIDCSVYAVCSFQTAQLMVNCEFMQFSAERNRCSWAFFFKKKMPNLVTHHMVLW